MRALSAVIAAGFLAYIAGPAAACSPPPPPNWHGWLNDPSVAISLARVERVEMLPPDNSGGVIIVPGTAHIVTLEVIQGAPTVNVAQVSGAMEVRQSLTPGVAPLCLNYLNHKEGDLVMMVQTAPSNGPLVYHRGWATLPQLTPYFEKYQ